jgi:hypothetical protein
MKKGFTFFLKEEKEHRESLNEASIYHYYDTKTTHCKKIKPTVSLICRNKNFLIKTMPNCLLGEGASQI